MPDKEKKQEPEQEKKKPKPVAPLFKKSIKDAQRKMMCFKGGVKHPFWMMPEPDPQKKKPLVHYSATGPPARPPPQ